LRGIRFIHQEENGMLLRSFFLEILHEWQSAFPRQPSYRRAVAQALGTLTALGRRLVSRHLGARS
jgi:hypothetical protein